MRISSIFPRLNGVSLSLMLGIATFGAQPLIVAGDAHAQGYNHGVILSGKRGAIKPRANFRNVGKSRSGVRYGKIRRDRLGSSRYYLKKRQREIARRNIRVERNNELRRLRASTRRSGPNGRFLNRSERDYLLNNNVVGSEIISTSQGGVVRNPQACPSGHDCGYRIYSDGTGPRIITPGVRLGNGLPSYDGLNGPKIITLD